MRRTAIKGFCGRLSHPGLLLALLVALPLSAGTARIYVANESGTTVMVIDPVTNKVVQTIEGVESPRFIAFSPDASRVYIVTYSEAVLDVVDRVTGQIIKKVPVSDFPNCVAVTKDGRRILVGIHDGPGVVDVIDATTFERIKSIPVGRGVHNMYVTPDGKYAVTGTQGSNVLTVIDLQTLQEAWRVDFTLDGAVAPMAIEANPDGSTRRIFVQFHPFHGFVVIDFATHKEVARIKLPDEPRTTKPWILPTLKGTTSHGMGISPDGKTLWVNSSAAGAVFAYSLPDLKLLGHALVGDNPQWLTITPDSKRVYVSNSGSQYVSVIDAKTFEEVARIPAGEIVKQSFTLALP